MSWLKKLDWVFLIRFIMGLPFLFIAYAFDDWFPAIFGLAIIATGIIAAFTKTGCGYAGGCSHNPHNPQQQQQQQLQEEQEQQQKQQQQHQQQRTKITQH